MHPEKYLRYLVPTSLFGTARTKEILTSNPITDLARQDARDFDLKRALAKREGTGMPGPKQLAKQFKRWEKRLA